MFPAGLYKGEKGIYLAPYNFYSDIFTLLPRDFPASYMGHVGYSYGNRHGAVELYYLESEADTRRICKTVKEISKIPPGYLFKQDTHRASGEFCVPNKSVELALLINNIQAQFNSHIPEAQRKEAFNFTLADIAQHCRGVEAQTLEQAVVELTKRVIPRTRIGYCTPTRMVTPGKQDFVPYCKLDGNIDYNKGCATSWIPGEGGGDFDGEYFKNYWYYIFGECGGCYSYDDHKPFAKSFYRFDEGKLREDLHHGIFEFETRTRPGKPIKILRFGKRTEPCSKWTLDNFVRTLEIMEEEGTRGVITTKMLEFDKKIAGLVKRTKSVIMFSVGNFDRFQEGAVALGCDLDFRRRNALKYKKAGCNTNYYLNCLGHGLTKTDRMLITEALKNQMGVQFLPWRFTEKFWAEKYTGSSWQTLKSPCRTAQQMDCLDSAAGSYFYEYNYLLPLVGRLDPEILNLVGDDTGQIRMCHHDRKTTFCGSCFTGKGLIADTIHIEKKNWRTKKPRSQRTPKTLVVVPGKYAIFDRNSRNLKPTT